MNDQAKFVVMTRARIREGHLGHIAELFEKTNPQLVKGEPDWLESVLTVNTQSNEVTVLAYWRSSKSYTEFSNSTVFQETMGQFMPHLTEPPSVSINKIVIGMTQSNIWK